MLLCCNLVAIFEKELTFAENKFSKTGAKIQIISGERCLSCLQGKEGGDVATGSLSVDVEKRVITEEKEMLLLQNPVNEV